MRRRMQCVESHCTHGQARQIDGSVCGAVHKAARAPRGVGVILLLIHQAHKLLGGAICPETQRSASVAAAWKESEETVRRST